MSPEAGIMLIKKIMPLVEGAIARGVVRAVGSEDFEELKADGCAIAAAMLHSAETNGKTFTPGNIVFFTLQTLKSGRRSACAGRLDVLSPAAAADGFVQLQSMDENIGFTPEGDELTLHDCIADENEDAGAAAARRLDWGAVEATLDNRRRGILRETSMGYGPSEIAERLRVSPPRVVKLRQSCKKEITAVFGAAVLTDIATLPFWRSGLRATRESVAGKYTDRIAPARRTRGKVQAPRHRHQKGAGDEQ